MATQRETYTKPRQRLWLTLLPPQTAVKGAGGENRREASIFAEIREPPARVLNRCKTFRLETGRGQEATGEIPGFSTTNDFQASIAPQEEFVTQVHLHHFDCQKE